MLEWFKRMYSKLPWVTDWSHIERLRQLVDSGVFDDELDQAATPQQPPPPEDYADLRPFELASYESDARIRQKRHGTTE